MPLRLHAAPHALQSYYPQALLLLALALALLLLALAPVLSSPAPVPPLVVR